MITQSYPFTSLGQMIQANAAQFPNRPALMAPAGKEFETVDYKTFAKRIEGYAGFLKSLGMVRGDRLVILSENCAEWIYAHYAGLSLGLITVPIYPLCRPIRLNTSPTIPVQRLR